MKFAKSLENTATELPIEWRPYLLKYKPLKKCINRIVTEMETRGLTVQIRPESNHETHKVEYMFSGDPGDLHPWLKIAVESNDTSESTELFKDRAPNEFINIPAPKFKAHDRNYIYVELDSEVEFFNMLTTDMNNAMALSEQVQREQFETDVSKLEKQIAIVASPKCKDMYIWREIFRLYIESKIFQGTASIEKSKYKMQGFVEEIETMKLLKRMNTKTSKSALKAFLELNASLMVFNQFYTANQTAVTKILKKHDKRSGLTCLIKAQKKRMLNCPVCRAEKAVANADATNLDIGLQNLMQTYFAREIKEKRKENEREQAIIDCQAIMGRQYTGDEACTIM
ncbi:unnamed protein product [Umbelopsis vinacea]